MVHFGPFCRCRGFEGQASLQSYLHILYSQHAPLTENVRVDARLINGAINYDVVTAHMSVLSVLVNNVSIQLER